MIADGPQKCVFRMKNVGTAPVVIYRVVTSCGCTEPEWTEAPIRPGESGEISVLFTNDQGPYPFDKSVTVYVSDQPKPIVLKVRGVAHDKVRSLSELFPLACGPLGFREGKVSPYFPDRQEAEKQRPCMSCFVRLPCVVKNKSLHLKIRLKFKTAIMCSCKSTKRAD